MDLTLNNKVVLITGASRGIGKETAKLFAKAGAEVVINFNDNIKAAEQTLSELSGANHIILQADISDPVLVNNLVDKVIKEKGRIDILVNNAGIYEEFSILELTYEEWQKTWEKTIKTNLTAAANLTFCTIKQMVKNGGGKIINVSSRGAFRGEPNAPSYGASKAGLNSLGQSMAKALAPNNIFVYTVAPGFVETDMAEPFLKGADGESIKNQSPTGRAAKPIEVANTIIFLASENTEYLTGCIIDINGASYLRT